MDNTNKQKNEIPIERVNFRIGRILSIIAKRHVEKDIQNKISEIFKNYNLDDNINDIPSDIATEIEETISNLTFKFEYRHTGTQAPPENVKERGKWLYDKADKNQSDI